MRITASQVIVWLVVGAISGTLAGMLITRTKRGFGVWHNLGIGLMGALIGGALFRVLRVDLGLGELAISFQDLLAALVGSLIFLAALWFARRARASG